MSPLMAQSGHHAAEFQCLLLGVKRTLLGGAPMSAFDPKRTFALQFCCDAHGPNSGTEDLAPAHDVSKALHISRFRVHALQKAKRVERANGDQFEAHHMCFT